MKKRCMIFVILVAVFSFSFIPSNAFAISQGWHIVTVDYAGPVFGKMVIRVDAVNNSFTDQWLELNSDMDKSLLATALTAMTMGSQARIWVMDDPHNLVGLTVQTCYSILFSE